MDTIYIQVTFAMDAVWMDGWTPIRKLLPTRKLYYSPLSESLKTLPIRKLLHTRQTNRLKDPLMDMALLFKQKEVRLD